MYLYGLLLEFDGPHLESNFVVFEALGRVDSSAVHERHLDCIVE
jgi:hypothetical protein